MNIISITAPSGILCNAALHIIQGLEQLGIDVVTDTNVPLGGEDGRPETGGANIFSPYSVISPTRFRRSDDISQGPLFVDLTYGMPSDWGALVEAMSRRPVIFLNMNDNCTLMDYPQQWIVFSANHSKHAQKGGRQFPFPLGVSADLLTIIDQKRLLDRPRNGRIIRNFRPSANQNTRDTLDLALVPQLARFFHVDTSFGSDLDQYIHNMSSASAVLAYGGQFIFDYFEPSNMPDEHNAATALASATKQYRFTHFRGPVEVLRWDGWRFYEACAFGCAPFQLNFEKYGFSLPRPPQAWQDYIPIDLEEVSFLPCKLLNELRSDPDYLANIGASARKWLDDNTSPIGLAKYVLETLGSVANAALQGQATPFDNSPSIPRRA